MDAFATALAGPGLRYTPEEWDPIYRQYTPPATASTSDYDSEGYEARVTANLTSNWRLVANYSYTDSGLTNLAKELAAWYGLKPADEVRMVQGVSQDANGQFVVDASAFNPDGTVVTFDVPDGIAIPAGGFVVFYQVAADYGAAGTETIFGRVYDSTGAQVGEFDIPGATFWGLGGLVHHWFYVRRREDAARCHRSVLRDILAEAGARMAGE